MTTINNEGLYSSPSNNEFRKFNTSNFTATCFVFLLILVKRTLAKCLELTLLQFKESTKYTVPQIRLPPPPPPSHPKKCKVYQCSVVNCTVTDADVHQLSVMMQDSNVRCMLNNKTMYIFTAHSKH
jgi:hypothetical protein